MKYAASALLCVMMLSVALFAADKPKKGRLRTWADKSGKFKVTARFVELKDGKVTLETDAGKTVELAIEKLSDSDQKAAKELAKEAEENPFQEKEDNPFEAGDSESPKGGGAGKLSEANWSDVDTLTPEPVEGWSFQPDEAPAFEKTLTSKAIMLDGAAGSKSKGGGQISVFEKIDSLLFDRAHGQALAVLHDAAPGKPKVNRIQRVDLVSGKPQAAFEYASDLKPVDIDSTGTYLAARPDFFFTGQSDPVVTVWKLSDKGVKHVRSWNTVEQGDFFKKEASLVKFIDADHLITLSFPNKLTMWQISKAKAVYKLEIAHGGGVAISPTGKYLAASVKNALFLFDALTGQTVATLADQNVMVNSLAFREDGKQLAAGSNQRLIVWDLEKGSVYRDIYFPQAIPQTTIDWIGKRHVLMGGERAVDLDKRIVLWQYQHEGGNAAAQQSYGEFGGQFWYALTSQDRKARGIFHVKLPHDDALKAAASLNADELLAIRPGATVSLNVNVQGAPAEQQQVLQDLTNQLQKLGMKVANSSQLVLFATTEAGKTQDITYRSFGGGGNQTAKVTDYICRLKFVENGKVIWETSSFTDGSPPMLQIKQGQSLQDALAPYQKPNLKFYSNVKLPEYVARPGDAVAYGASMLTSQGIKAAPNGPTKIGVAGR